MIEITPLTIGYVVKMFPRLSETFILNEILELEGRGVRVVVFSMLKPNEGRFHPQLAQLQAPVYYLEDLDPKRYGTWMAAEWDVLAPRRDALFRSLEDALASSDARRVDLVWFAAWIASQAKRMSVDRLHAHFASAPSTLALLAHRIGGIPFSFTAHAKDIFVYAPEETDLRAKLREAEFVVTVTEYNRRFLQGIAPDVDAGKIHVVQNGVRLGGLEPGSFEARSPDHILAVGRLVPKKGFANLLDACSILRARGVSFRCTIVGTGPEEAMLQEKRRELGLTEFVDMIGARNQAEVLDLMKCCTLLCLPCTVGLDNNVDALPTVLLEALACGLPVVSTAISGIPEIVDSGSDGLLVPPDDAAAVADAVQGLLADGDRRREFARRGLEKVRRKFDLATNADTLLRLHAGGAGAPNGLRPVETIAEQGMLEGARRILYLCADRGISFGGHKGASVHLREFASALQRAGHVVHVAVRRREAGADTNAPFPVHVLPSEDHADFFDHATVVGESAIVNDLREFDYNGIVRRWLGDLHARERFDAVIERYSLFGIAGRAFAREAGIPYVLEVNAPLVEEAPVYRILGRGDIARAVEHYLFDGADRIMAVSEELRGHIVGLAPCARVTVLPNGVDVARFEKAPDRDAWRRRFTKDPDRDFVIGFVGRVRPWHGVDLLVDAAGRLAAGDARTRLCIVGDCGDLEAELRARCRDAGLDGRVVFTGAVLPDDVPSILQAIDVVTAPYPPASRFYFSPLKVFEYMAAGRPIVASAIGQVADILAHQHTALLTAPGDVAGLASSLERLRDDVALAARLGANAREEARRLHDWRTRVDIVIGQLPRSESRRQDANSRSLSTR